MPMPMPGRNPVSHPGLEPETYAPPGFTPQKGMSGSPGLGIVETARVTGEKGLLLRHDLPLTPLQAAPTVESMSDTSIGSPAPETSASSAAEGAQGSQGQAPVSTPASTSSGDGAAGQGQAGGSVAGAESGPGRNPDGTFAKSSAPRIKGTLDSIPDSDFEPGPAAPKVAKPIPDKPGTPGTVAPAPAAPKFKFAGKDYDTLEAAEQSFRSLQGMFKPLQDRVDSLQRQLAQPAAASQPPAPVAAAPKPGEPAAGAAPKPAGPTDPMSGIDLSTYKAIAASQGPEVAAYWLQQEVTKTVTESLRGEFKEQLDSAMAPYRQTAEVQQHLGVAQNLYYELASYSTPGADGNPVPTYPELTDGDAAERIGQLWYNLPLTPEARNSVAGMHMAVAVYRDLVRGGVFAPGASPAPSPTTPPPAGDPNAPVAPHPGALAAASAAAASLLGRTPGGDAISGHYPSHREPMNGHAAEVSLMRDGIDKARILDPRTGVSR